MTRYPFRHPPSRRPAAVRGRLLAGAAPLALAAATLLSGTAQARQDQGPVQQPMPASPPAPIAAPQDRAYPGTITLHVDATDTDRHIFTGHETIPVSQAGDLVLLFPKWLPGDHSPTGELDKFASLVVTANGQGLPWVRDTLDVYAFHVPVPAGASSITLDYQYLSPTTPSQGRVTMTDRMLNLQWNNILLYPAGYFSRGITIDASATLPKGWTGFSGLDAASQAGSEIHYKPVPLNTLIDNPVLAGLYAKREDLTTAGGVPVHLDIVADEPDDLAISAAVLGYHRNLVTQAQRLFGAHHYDHYDFLLSLSDTLGGIGLEHHRSSENGVDPDYFTAWDKSVGDHDLLPHEYTHSWNGKFRRPADLWQPNFNTPEGDTLLWVYEGQTQYWGNVLAARSGLRTKQDTLDMLALVGAVYGDGNGRSWRNLQDTDNDPIIAQRRPIPWRGWQRSEDYYEEGLLVWLDVDTQIRALSHGTKSLDDFAHGFFGVNNGSYVVKTYRFADVVEALNAVAPFDWSGFLRKRLDATGGPEPLDGFTRGGYRLVFTDTESSFEKHAAEMRHLTDFSYSLGLAIGKGDVVRGVQWNSPAFKAGIAVGTQVVAVDGIAYDKDGLVRAITDAKSSQAPIALLLKDGEHYRTVSIDYHGGLRYPHLQRIANTPDGLGSILAAKP